MKTMIVRGLRGSGQSSDFLLTTTVHSLPVVDDIVWHTIEGHGNGHVVHLVTDTTIGELENGQQSEDHAGRGGLSDLIDELVVPEDLVRVDVTVPSFDVRGLGPDPEVLSTSPASLPSTVGEKHLDDFARLHEDRSLWWGLVQLLISENEDDWHDHVDDSRLKERQPESDLYQISTPSNQLILLITHESFTVDGGKGEEGSDVDAPVEDVQVSLNGHLGVEDDKLSALERLQLGDLDWGLVTQKWCETWLDESSAESKDDDGNGESTEGTVGVLDDSWNGRDDKDDVGNSTDS